MSLLGNVEMIYLSPSPLHQWRGVLGAPKRGKEKRFRNDFSLLLTF